uniref:Gamma interferon inducible lysosomal thiol reductase n=1 Tax=Haemonchus contortus TaxID=6289 RepID=A0A6F7NYM5_HAECO
MRRQLARSGLRRYLYATAAVLLLFLMYRWFTRRPEPNLIYGYRGEIMLPEAPAAPKLNTVKLEIYMESQCPDTSRFLHKQLMKAWSLLSQTGRVELVLVPFGKARCVAKGDNDFECSCQHQANECILNQLMNCVIDRVGFPDKIVPIIDCIQGKFNLENAMQSCISNNPLLDEAEMQACATGPRGRRLLAIAGARTAALHPRLDFVPWIMIDGERNTDALYDLTENLCKKLEPAPEACSDYMQSLKRN